MNVADYRQRASNSKAWIDTGRRLLSGADLLWAEVRAGFILIESVLPRFTKEGLPVTVSSPDEFPEFQQWLDQMQQALVVRLLDCYAIENLLKAVRVRRRVLQGAEVVDEKRRLVDIPMDHNYLNFARREFGGALSETEMQLLRKLSVTIQWAGRYSVAKSPSEAADWLPFATVSDEQADVQRLADRIIALHDSLD